MKKQPPDSPIILSKLEPVMKRKLTNYFRMVILNLIINSSKASETKTLISNQVKIGRETPNSQLTQNTRLTSSMEPPIQLTNPICRVIWKVSCKQKKNSEVFSLKNLMSNLIQLRIQAFVFLGFKGSTPCNLNILPNSLKQHSKTVGMKSKDLRILIAEIPCFPPTLLLFRLSKSG